MLFPSTPQNVTLGGTGKEVGDRHPKVSENVLIGASATILGNIVVSAFAVTYMSVVPMTVMQIVRHKYHPECCNWPNCDVFVVSGTACVPEGLDSK